jgi:hypothetical protein
MVQNIAKLQALENTRRKVPPSQSRGAALVAPQRTPPASASPSAQISAPPQTAAQATAVPRPNSPPLPPLPVPPDYKPASR